MYCISCKGLHLFIGEGGKGKSHLREPRDRKGKGHLGMGKGLLELYRRWSQRTSSGIPRMIAFNLLEENSLPSTVDRQGCIGRPSEVEAIDRRGSHLQEFLYLQLSIAIRTRGRPSEAIGRPLSGQRSTACRLSQVILPTLIKILQMTQMTQENRKVTQ